METEVLTFKSKVSYLLVGLFMGLFVFTLCTNFGEGNKGILHTGFTILMGLFWIFMVYSFYNTYYRIEGDSLKIHSGFLYNKTILISTIKRIEKSNSLLSSPAPSFDRIEVLYGKFDSILISPKNKEDFSKALQKINPDIILKL